MKINVKVQANSGRQELIKINENNYKVFLKKLPGDGKANLEFEGVLKKFFGVDIKIIKGFTSKNKMIEVRDGD